MSADGMALSVLKLMRSIQGSSVSLLLMLLAGIITPLLVLEGAVRLLTSAPPTKSGAELERPSVFYLPAHASSARGNVFSVHKPANTFRIGIVGDSFTFAPKMQFFDTFPARLERLLNLADVPSRVEVINYGSPGFSTHHEVNVVEKALEANCDLVLLQITLNDAQERPLGHNPLITSSRGGGVASYSKLLQMISTRIDAIKSKQRHIDYHYDLFSAPKTKALFENSITHMKVAADAHHVPFAAVVFPLFDFPIDESYPFKELHEQITTFLASRGIPTLDLQKAFSGLDVTRLQLIPGRDSHPNEIAHRIAAEAIDEWMRTQKFLPEQFFTSHAVPQRNDVRDLQVKAPIALSEIVG